MKKSLIGLFFTILCFICPLDAQLVYQEKPADFNSKMEVAACFIRVDDQVLFLKRLPHKPQGNTWGIPGGKFDEGENAQQTVLREVREETGIEIPKESLHYFGEYYIRYPEMDYVFHLFEYQTNTLPQVTHNPAEHAGYQWMTFQDALNSLPLIPGNDECIDLAYDGAYSIKPQETA